MLLERATVGIAGLMTGLFFGLIASVSAADLLSARTISENKQCVQEMNQIRQMRTAQDASGLTKLGEQIQIEWSRTEDRDYYFALSDAVVTALANCSSDGDSIERSRFLARKYALLALNDHGQVPLDVETDLMGYVAWPDYIEYAHGTLEGEAWSRLRSERMKHWCDIWERLKQDEDSTIDLHKRLHAPFLDLPDGKDVVAQAAYDNAIRAFNKKVKEYEFQHDLRLLDDRSSYLAEGVVVAMYSRPPYNTNELIVLLDASKMEQEKKSKTLAQVRENRSKRVW